MHNVTYPSFHSASIVRRVTPLNNTHTTRGARQEPVSLCADGKRGEVARVAPALPHPMSLFHLPARLTHGVFVSFRCAHCSSVFFGGRMPRTIPHSRSVRLSVPAPPHALHSAPAHCGQSPTARFLFALV